MDWVTTSTLLERLRDGDDARAWNDFVGQFREAVVRYACRRGLDEGVAQDVAQNTLMSFVKGYRAGQYEPGRGRLRAWLFGIAHNQVRMAWRRRDRDRLVTAGDLVSSPGAGGLAAAVQEQVAEQSLLQLRREWQHEWQQMLFANCLERVRFHVSDDTFHIFRVLTCGEATPKQLAESRGVHRSRIDNAKARVLARVMACIRRFEDA